MDGRILTRSPARFVAGLVALAVALAISDGAHAAPKGNKKHGDIAEAEKYTVGLFTYVSVDGKPRFAKAFSGVLDKDGKILTSAWALEQGLSDPFTKVSVKDPTQVLAVFRKGQSVVIARCMKSSLGAGSPLAVLEVDEAQRDMVKQIAAESAPRTRLKPGPGTVVLGIVAPDGLKPKQLSPQSVPQPLAMSIRMGDLRSFGDGQYEGAMVLASLPPQMIGAGVWDNTGNLMGILVRSDSAWHVMDTKDIGRLMTPPPKVEVAVEAPAPDKPGAEPMVVETPKGKSFADIFKELKLEKKWDDKMLDHTGNFAVDSAQAYLAAGQPKEALKAIEEAEKGSDERERLKYLKAVATIMDGQFEKAIPMTTDLHRANDPVLAARGRTVQNVLAKAPSGNYEGKMLTTPDGFQGAYLGWLERIKGQVEEGYEAAEAMPMTSAAEFKRRDGKLEQALSRADTYRLAWAGYWDELIGKMTKDRTESAQKAKDLK